MKNFRKSIIALATAAAMLIPSVAMAATLTTTVDKDIDGDVYVGFYDGAVLKDVVKTTVADATVTDAAAAAEELPCTVTITDEVSADYVRADGAEVRKLVFTATADARISMVDILLSYDNTKVVPLVPNEEMIDIDLDAAEMLPIAYESALYPYAVGNYVYDKKNALTGKVTEATGTYTIAGGKQGTIGNRTGVSIDTMAASGTFAKLNNGAKVAEFYYRVLDGQTVDKDTFKIETEKGAGTLHELIKVDPGNEYGVKLQSPDGDLTYSCNAGGAAVADSIALVTPWDVQEVTTKTLSVDVPAGAEGYAATMFIWDENQIAQCDPINF